MRKIKSGLSTSLFSFVFLVSIFCSNASLEPDDGYLDVRDMDFIGLERFKNELFSPEIVEANGSNIFASNNLKCLKELVKIGYGLYNNTEEWALKSKMVFSKFKIYSTLIWLLL